MIHPDHTSYPLRVIQLIDGFATEEQSGGAGLFGIQLARHLNRRICTPMVCGLWHYGTPSERRWREQLHAEGIATIVLIEQRTRIAHDMVRAAGLLWQVVHRVQPALLNSHFERGDMLSLFHRIWHPLHPCIIRTMHADQQWQTRPWLGALLNVAAFPWWFDGEVAISQATKQGMDARCAARVRRRTATLLYNGIPRSLIDNAAALRARQGDCPRPPHPPRLAIIGRLEPQKGHHYFVQACATLLTTHPTLEAWVIGTGSLRDAITAEVHALGISHAIHFLGQRNDVPDILQQVDILVSASIWEGFPTVILEAMAAYVPVVATDVSGSRELVRNNETGLIVPMRDSAALAHAIGWLLDNPPARQRMALNGWQQARTYTIEHTAQGYDTLYQQVCQKRLSS